MLFQCDSFEESPAVVVFFQGTRLNSKPSSAGSSGTVVARYGSQATNIEIAQAASNFEVWATELRELVGFVATGGIVQTSIEISALAERAAAAIGQDTGESVDEWAERLANQVIRQK